MAYKTDPSLVIMRLKTEAARLNVWALRNGDAKQKKVSYDLVIALDKVSPIFLPADQSATNSVE